MTFDAGSNIPQESSAGATATQRGPVVPAQQGSMESTQQGRVEPAQQGPVEAEATPEVTGPLAGDPLSLGLPSFIIGSVALGMVLVGFVSPLGTGASLPIILAATALGLIISTLWAIAVGQSAVALVLGVFGGFWLSYSFLILGLTHNWFGVTAADVQRSTELFLIAWVVIFSMLTLATLRLAAAFTAVIGLVDVAVILVLIGVIQAEPNLLKAGGATAFLFAVVGIYIFFGSASIATGGKAVPLGRPVLK
jgi:succinate-acetate transporter protein